MPATIRLRAEAKGYPPLTLSPFLDNPALVELVTRLGDDDLLNWNTYEHCRAAMSNVELTFRLRKP